MSISYLIIITLILGTTSFVLGRKRALAAVGGNTTALRSRPGHYGWFAALWCGLPGMAIILLWLLVAPDLLDKLTLAALSPGTAGTNPAQVHLFLNDVHNIADGNLSGRAGDPVLIAAARHYAQMRDTGLSLMLALGVILSLSGALTALRAITPRFSARARVERIINIALIICSTLAILVTAGIVLSLLFETLRFFDKVPLSEFLFGLRWSPQTALRADQVASSGSFGAVPLFAGTLLITVIAIVVAGPVGLMAAIYLSYYAHWRVRATVKPILEVLAGVPTVVYGFFAALVVAPAIRSLGLSLGLDVASESALAAGLVMGLMIVPFISSLSDDAITAVPQSLRDGSLGLGATPSETIRQVILPAALPGIVSAFLLAISRAIGETMIVVMAAGLAANLTANPLKAVTTVTVQIVTLLTGDQEFDSAKTLAAFALGLVLFLITLVINGGALYFVRKYREIYD
jgi:phosphate transport system permease protein